MRFIWTDLNVRKVAEHGLTTDEVERVFQAEEASFTTTAHAGRRLVEAELDRGLVRVIYTESEPNAIYVVTAYPLSRKRRRT